MKDDLKPCPFCGRVPELAETDEEGNFKPHPRPAGFVIVHTLMDRDDPCPIVTDRGIQLGVWIYNTREDAIEAWNRRA